MNNYSEKENGVYAPDALENCHDTSKAPSRDSSTKGFYVYDFMGLDLKLKAPTIYVFALIYSYTAAGKYEFYATRSYIAERCGISLTAVSRALKELVDKKLIIKVGASSAIPNVFVYRADTCLVGLVLAEREREKKEKAAKEKKEKQKQIREQNRLSEKINIKEYIKTL